MKLPKSFVYKGHTWTIKIVSNLIHDDRTKCDGICDTDLRVVYIDKDLSSKAKTQAFLHELFHVLIHETHIPLDAPFTETVEDIVAEAFSDMLCTLLKTGWQK